MLRTNTKGKEPHGSVLRDAVFFNRLDAMMSHEWMARGSYVGIVRIMYKTKAAP